jgi:hypothetical protein
MLTDAAGRQEQKLLFRQRQKRELIRMLTDADICGLMLTYADVY